LPRSEKLFKLQRVQNRIQKTRQLVRRTDK
jgi:hypothetical protein